MLFAFMMPVVLVFLLWRCQFGFAYADESFYLTIPYRLCQGDILLLHEWHGTQLSGLLLLPLVKGYLVLFGTTEGILFAFRILFTVIWWITGLFLFLRLKSYSEYGSMIAVFCFLFYAPYGIMALSYYSMGLLLFLCACVIISTAKTKAIIQWAISGVLFAASVLCFPFLVLGWIIFCIAAVIDLFVLKKRIWEIWLFFSIGAGVVFFLFCIYLFQHAPLTEYLRTIPMVFNDPEHPFTPWLEKIRHIIYSARLLNPYWLGIVVLSFVVTLQTKLCKTYALGFFVICGAITVLLLTYRWMYHLGNLSMFPFSLLGLFCFACSRDPEIKKLFFSIWLPGLLFSFYSGLSSNQGYFAFASGSTVMTIASVIIGVRFLSLAADNNMTKNARMTMITAFAIAVVVQVSCEFADRYNNVFWDDAGGIANQTVIIEEGPEKGLWTNEDVYDFYCITQSDLKSLKENTTIEQILFLSKNTWLYLNVEKGNASYSAWLSGVNDLTFFKLEQYYSMFPEKRPDTIVVDRDYREYVPMLEKKGYCLSDVKTSEYHIILHHVE